MLQKVLSFIAQADWVSILGVGMAFLAALVAVLHALVALFMLIPGEQPEKALKVVADWMDKVVAFVSKYSAKLPPK